MRAQRLLCLDVFRGLAVLWMIETHVFNASLSADFRHGLIYHLVYMSNGYVANAFAFCAGAGFWLSATLKPDLAKIGSRDFWKFLRRTLFILMVGYWLNIHSFSLEFVRTVSGTFLLQIFQSDILQVIGFSALISLGVLLVLRKPRATSLVLLTLALAVFLVTPWVWSRSPLDSLPLWAAMPLVKIPPGKFPLFPWMGYYFAGVGLTEILLNAKNPRRTAVILALAALATPFLAYHIKEQDWTYPGMSSAFADWYPSPGHTLFRLSGVVLVFSLLFLLENVLQKAKPVSGFLARNGQESLSLYITHIFLIYGSSVTLGLCNLAPNLLNPLETALCTVVIACACYTVAMGWKTFKTVSPRGATAVLAALAAAGMIYFLLAPADWRVGGAPL